MVEGEVDSNMQKFLSDRKINIADLAKQVKAESSETTAERNTRLRALAVVKREAETSSINMEDAFESNVQENYAIVTNLHDQCFIKCAHKKDISYLTMPEGLCFRNCLNKFNNWYPRLEEQTRDAAFKTYWGMTKELEAELKRQ